MLSHRFPGLRSCLLMAALLWPAVSPAQATLPADAAVTINVLHGALITSMKSGASCSDRARLLRPAVVGAYDFEFLAQRVVRRRWDTLSASQRKDFQAALEDLAVATYTEQFARWNGERFETLKTEQQGSGLRVMTRILRKDAPPVSLDYLMRDAGGSWRIVNVIAEGISDLAIRSSQYEGVIREQGFDALVSGILQKRDEAVTACNAKR